MTLMRFDPFRQFEQIMEQNFAGTRTPRTVPMTALRRGDTFIVDLDLPGVVEDDVELTVERNVVTIRARRAPARQDGDEVIIDERPYGEFTRQLFLGDNLDAGRMTVAQDPTGAIFGVWQAGTHHGAELANEPGSFQWNELETRDPTLSTIVQRFGFAGSHLKGVGFLKQFECFVVGEAHIFYASVLGV